MADFSLDNPEETVQLFHMTIGDVSLITGMEANSQLLIPYKAVSQPIKTAELPIYQFSLDNDKWFGMLSSTGTQLTGLDPNVNWKEFEFTWLYEGATGIQGDTGLVQGDTGLGDALVYGETGIEGSIYDREIWLKLRMVSDDLYSTSIQKIYLKSTEENNDSLKDNAPLSHEGMGTLDVLKQAPPDV